MRHMEEMPHALCLIPSAFIAEWMSNPNLSRTSPSPSLHRVILSEEQCDESKDLHFVMQVPYPPPSTEFHHSNQIVSRTKLSALPAFAQNHVQDGALFRGQARYGRSLACIFATSNIILSPLLEI